MAFWVHVEQGEGPWYRAEHFLPAAPTPLPRRGYAILCVEFSATVLRFSSAAQLAECIRVLSLRPLPLTRRLAQLRGRSAGPNSHWLSRVPASLKTPKARARLVAVLQGLATAGDAFAVDAAG